MVHDSVSPTTSVGEAEGFIISLRVHPTAPKTSNMEMNTKLYEDVARNMLGMENAAKDDDQVFRSFFGAPILIVVLLSLNDVKTT